jgi:hypothetical protein
VRLWDAALTGVDVVHNSVSTPRYNGDALRASTLGEICVHESGISYDAIRV